MRSAADTAALEGWIDPISYGVIALVVVVYLWRVVTFKQR